jgi:hypothetical protein
VAANACGVHWKNGTPDWVEAFAGNVGVICGELLLTRRAGLFVSVLPLPSIAWTRQ